MLAPALATRDLVVFDQRGTGELEPAALLGAARAAAAIVTSAVQRCAEPDRAGPRLLHAPPQSVQDLESLRVAGGYDKLVLFGVSYGTKVAEDYAAAYPTNVAGARARLRRAARGPGRAAPLHVQGRPTGPAPSSAPAAACDGITADVARPTSPRS